MRLHIKVDHRGALGIQTQRAIRTKRNGRLAFCVYHVYVAERRQKIVYASNLSKFSHFNFKNIVLQRVLTETAGQNL